MTPKEKESEAIRNAMAEFQGEVEHQPDQLVIRRTYKTVYHRMNMRSVGAGTVKLVQYAGQNYQYSLGKTAANLKGAIGITVRKKVVKKWLGRAAIAAAARLKRKTTI